MKFFWPACLILLSSVAVAQTDTPVELQKHQVTFGSDRTLALSGTKGEGDVDSTVGTEDFDLTRGNFSINYAYRFIGNVQIGFNLSRVTSEQERKINSSNGGGKIETTDNQTAFYVFGTYNFKEDFSNSWYITLALGRENVDAETKDTSGPSKSSTKSDYQVTGFNFEVGHRFSMKHFGIQNLTYSPSISYKNGNAGGDLEDAGVDSLSQFTFDVVKFDLLF